MGTKQWSTWLLPPLTVLIVLLLWQLLTATGVVSPVQFPTMTATMSALWSEIATGRIWSAIVATLVGWAIGMFITILLGPIVGTALAYNGFARRSAAPRSEEHTSELQSRGQH